MLLITRREGEALVINGSIEVRILEIRGGRVKLGIEYPVGNTVFRQELFAKIQAENQAAAQPLAAAANVTDAGRLQEALVKIMKKSTSAQLGTDTARELGKEKAQPNDHDRRHNAANREPHSDDE